MDDLALSPAVSSALAKGRPVVALESTVLTHGLPWPQNLAVLRSLEEILVNAGVTPATIIVLNGTARVGVDEELIDKITPLLNPTLPSAKRI
jgi:pseudouridine-5'-phosphate glycosidase